MIPAGKQFQINSVMSFTGCKNCEIQIEGTLKVSDDLDYWSGRKAIFSISGITKATIHSKTGSGVIDGNGQAAWDYFAQNSSYSRPTLMYITGSSGIIIDNIYFKNAPNVFHSAAGSSKDITYSNIKLYAVSKSSNVAHNTDGWDIGPASYVTMNNLTVTNDDDCIAFKPGANYVSVNGITCTGSHGLSVGSLGSKAGTVDTVSNVYVKNAKMIDSTKAAGVKLYPHGSSHGSAKVSNVTWDGVVVQNTDYAFQVQSCYGEETSYCSSNPSNSTLTDIDVLNFSGTTSTKYAPTTANVNCPDDGTCDVTFKGWTVKAGSGTGKVLCANSDGLTGVTCSSGASG